MGKDISDVGKQNELIVTPEDIPKLHNEMNQCINQGLTILTTAISLFGAAMGWLSTILIGQWEDKPHVLLLPIALLIMLSLMFIHIQCITKHMHIISAYLIKTKSSNWEGRYQKFSRPSNLISHTYISIWIFIILGGLSILISFPLFLNLLKNQNHGFIDGILICLFTLVSFVFLCLCIKNWQDRCYEEFRVLVNRKWDEVFEEENKS